MFLILILILLVILIIILGCVLIIYIGFMLMGLLVHLLGMGLFLFLIQHM